MDEHVVIPHVVIPLIKGSLKLATVTSNPTIYSILNVRQSHLLVYKLTSGLRTENRIALSDH